jgi:hypothetical protein
MYRVAYYIGPSETTVAFREFDTCEQALKFVTSLPNESLLEMKKYENSTDNGSTLRGKK